MNFFKKAQKKASQLHAGYHKTKKEYAERSIASQTAQLRAMKIKTQIAKQKQMQAKYKPQRSGMSSGGFSHSLLTPSKTKTKRSFMEDLI